MTGGLIVDDEAAGTVIEFNRARRLVCCGMMGIGAGMTMGGADEAGAAGNGSALFIGRPEFLADDFLLLLLSRAILLAEGAVLESEVDLLLDGVPPPLPPPPLLTRFRLPPLNMALTSSQANMT